MQTPDRRILFFFSDVVIITFESALDIWALLFCFFTGRQFELPSLRLGHFGEFLLNVFEVGGNIDAVFTSVRYHEDGLLNQQCFSLLEVNVGVDTKPFLTGHVDIQLELVG